MVFDKFGIQPIMGDEKTSKLNRIYYFPKQKELTEYLERLRS